MKKQLCIGLLTFFILSCTGCKNITYTDNKPDEPIKKYTKTSPLATKEILQPPPNRNTPPVQP